MYKYFRDGPVWGGNVVNIYRNISQNALGSTAGVESRQDGPNRKHKNTFIFAVHSLRAHSPPDMEVGWQTSPIWTKADFAVDSLVDVSKFGINL